MRTQSRRRVLVQLKSKARNAVAGALIGILIIAGLALLRTSSSPSRSLESCLRRGNCNGLVLIARDAQLAPEAAKRIFSHPLVRRAASFVKRVELIQPRDRSRHLALVIEHEGREAALLVRMLQTDEDAIAIGHLLRQLFTAEVLSLDPSIDTLGKLYDRLSERVEPLQPFLAQNGITRLDYGGPDVGPVEEFAAALRILGRNNSQLPVQVWRLEDVRRG